MSDTQPAQPEQQLEVQAKKTKKIIRRKKRPARVQVDPSTVKTQPPPQTGDIFNIWYAKWSGGERDQQYGLNAHAPYRVNIANDSGWTRADKVPGSYFCLHFARGSCWKGSECEYRHTLPTVYDLFPSTEDCFGRQKHQDYKDDMSGIGSFSRQNRTLYCGRITVSDDIEEVAARHFAEFGSIDRIRVLTAKGVAFITYTNEANAQFAKEAMSCQSLDHEEILNVRWATVDPNPLAQKREARKIEEQAAEAVRRALPAAFVAEIEGRDPEAKKRKKIEGSFGLDGYDVPDDVWHARTRQLESAAPTAQLQAPEEPLMLEAGSSAMPEPEPAPESGIFSSSTVAALRGLAGGNVTTQAAPQSSGGPLVAYGSDDDSD
ncbi:Pre-mRNA-splicing factor cwc2 [Penicillium macrosclerotiorum]|uniref:Pre-mRNA-splicing factor cwc2 n=1 Tax=Penicillium macrosclerotiorum TaxID=303699 RepID=UPI0025469E3E|nr:Pre-mRNA-splicing factor cwc2 [Penicillium macrosclerotiorum]KAJ5689096.1 Pre-mRNA-splicing factor cwc2 [Penicillium macrosclerotiorum]